jgi:hypothetical protein
MRILQRILLQMCTLKVWSWNLKIHIMWKDLSGKINQFTWKKVSVMFRKDLLASLTNQSSLSQTLSLSAYTRSYKALNFFFTRFKCRTRCMIMMKIIHHLDFFLWPVLKLYEWRLDHPGVGSFYRWRTFTAIKICKWGPLKILMRWKKHLHIPFTLPCGMSLLPYATSWFPCITL